MAEEIEKKPYRLMKHVRCDKTTGEVKESKKYRIVFRDHLNIQRRLTADVKESISDTIAQNVIDLVNLRKTNRPITPSLTNFLTLQPAFLREKLYEWGIIDTNTNASFKPLLEYEMVKKKRSKKERPEPIGGHVLDWKNSMYNRSEVPTEAQIRQNISRTVDIILGCRFEYPYDINADKVRAYLKSLQEKGTSPQTCNAYIKRVKVFTKWMKDQKITAIDSIENMKFFPVHELLCNRRDLTPEESKRLLQAALKSKVKVKRLTGYERYLVYLIALTTSLRWRSIRTLSREDINLEGDLPSITVKKENSKSRKTLHKYINEELAAELKKYLKATSGSPDELIFKNICKGDGVALIKHDLAVAGIPYETEDGKCDFHSLRSTCATMLSDNGVIDENVQLILDHSSVHVTRKHYIKKRKHKELKKKAVIIDKLPKELFACNW